MIPGPAVTATVEVRVQPIHKSFRSALTPWAAASLLLLPLPALTSIAGAATASAPPVRVGQPYTGSAGVQETTADIMRRAASDRGPAQPVLIRELEGPDRSRLPQNPASRRVASVPEQPTDRIIGYRNSKGIGVLPLTPQTIGPNFTAATLSGTNSTGSFPPDCDGAVGPTQYIVAVNGRIVSFNKTTGVADGVMNATTNSFFTSVRSGSGTSDPMVRYDRLSGRWFISIINVSTPNRWLLGVSDAASAGVITAGTVWTYYFFIPATTPPTISNGSTCLSDYPSLGIDANAVYMGVNEFCGSGQPFQQTDGFVIRKSSVLSGGPIVVTAFRGFMTGPTYVGPWSPRGVDNLDPASTEGYFLGTDGASYGTLDMIRITSPGGTPTASANIPITVPATDGPRPVPHPGNTGGYWGRLDPIDDRPFLAVIRSNQQLWTSHNIGVDNTGISQGTYLGDTRVGSRWYQFNVPVGAGTPTIVQSGTVFAPSASNDSLQKNYFIPSIMVSGQGHAALGYSTAGETDNANCGTVGRLANDPPGTMETPTALTSNVNTYNPSSDPGGISAGRPRRWGDYSITTLDPLDDMSMWTVQMFCDVNNSYGVRVAKLIAPPPAAPSGLADIIAGQPSVSVTLTGVSSSGSGFYDPGANLAAPALAFKHLSAAITVGAASGTPPTVTSATYVDPTTVNLVLNASSATPNATGQKYTITITNPDGQTSAAAIVHVITGVTYTITATAGSGGSISPSGAVIVQSTTNQTFAITPNACFGVADVLVDGVSVGPVTTYTFTNVNNDHTIDASFVALGPYTITASAGANGAIAPNGPTVVNCGANQAFTITPDACYHVSGVLVDGSSVGAVTTFTFSNVTANHTIAASFAANPLPAAVTGLAAAQVKTGNDASGTTRVTLTYTAPGGAASTEVWRTGFGNYPTYSGGGAPPLPGSYPPSGWALTPVTASGQADQPPTRDYWYYVAYAKDACGNAGPVSNLTGGVLGYHLGDVSDGITPGQGDNKVATADASLLGTHYGASGATLAGFEYLDVGPTTTNSVDGRPTVDGVVDFEDLVMFSINWSPRVSLVAGGTPASGPHAHDELSLQAPYVVTAGDAVEVPIQMTATGDLQAMSVSLNFDPAVVAPADVVAGDLVAAQGALLLSPGHARADVAMLGLGAGLAGKGVLATMHFKAIASGDPQFAFGRIIGRDAANKPLLLNARNPMAFESVVTITELQPVIPNPSRGISVLQYGLARRGVTDLSIYSVDGRRVKTLAHGVQEAGRYHFTWNGTDERGNALRSGVYFARLETAGTRRTRLFSVMR